MIFHFVKEQTTSRRHVTTDEQLSRLKCPHYSRRCSPHSAGRWHLPTHKLFASSLIVYKASPGNLRRKSFSVCELKIHPSNNSEIDFSPADLSRGARTFFSCFYQTEAIVGCSLEEGDNPVRVLIWHSQSRFALERLSRLIPKLRRRCHSVR